MPCNGVSVATLKVDQKDQMFLDMYSQEEVKEVICKFLENKNIEYSSYANSIELYKIKMRILFRGNNIAIRSYLYADQTISQTIEADIKKLLSAIAGVKRQQYIIAKLRKAGIKIDKQQTAKNGAIVIGTEI